MINTKLGTISYSVAKVGDNYIVANEDGEMLETFETAEEAKQYAKDMEDRMEGIINNNI